MPSAAASHPSPGCAAAESAAPIWIRGLRPDDYAAAAGEIDAWMRGRFAGAALSRSFFRHFADTSLLLLAGSRTAGVLVGFVSPREPQVACVHYLAIDPRQRRRGHGRALYDRYFALASGRGCTEVHAVVPPMNSGLIAFHRQLDFEVADADGFACGIAVCRDYAGPGQHRVLFRKTLAAPVLSGR